MAQVLQLRRGTTAQNDAFTGAVAEVSVDTDRDSLRVHDGATMGGKEIAPLQVAVPLLPDATTVNAADELIVQQSGITKRATATELLNGTATVTSTGSTTGRSLKDRFSDIVNVKDFGAKGDGTTDDTGACQAAVNAAVAAGGGTVIFPTGVYLLNGTTKADGNKDGITIPFISFDASARIRLVGMGKAILVAGSDNMFVVRVCQPASEVCHLEIRGGWNTGAGFSNTTGIGIVPEDLTQTTTLVSQSFVKVYGCLVTQCFTGLLLRGGPTVGGSQSGNFYPVITHNDFNLNGRSMWFRPSTNDATNRPTRGNIAFNRIERGNCGIDLEFATEFTLTGNKYQLHSATFNSSAIASVPFATSRAITLGALTEYTQILGDFDEGSQRFIVNNSTSPTAAQFVGILSGTSDGISAIPQFDYSNVRVTHPDASATNRQVAFVGKNNGFGRLVFDYDADGSKTASIETNGVERARWFNGAFTHFGSVGNTTISATGQLTVGDNIAFPATQVSSASANVLDDYEEGSFTPTAVGSTTAGSATYAEQVGRYTKIGNRVFYTISLDYSGHTGTGNLRISGLPFTSGQVAVVNFYVSDLALTAANVVQGFINSSATQVLVYQYPTGGGSSGLVPIDAAAVLRLTSHYEV